MKGPPETRGLRALFGWRLIVGSCGHWPTKCTMKSYLSLGTAAITFLALLAGCVRHDAPPQPPASAPAAAAHDAILPTSESSSSVEKNSSGHASHKVSSSVACFDV